MSILTVKKKKKKQLCPFGLPSSSGFKFYPKLCPLTFLSCPSEWFYLIMELMNMRI